MSDNEIIKPNFEDQSKILCEDGGLKDSIIQLIEKIFSDFDTDKDGVLNKEEIDKFAIKLNGKPFDEDSLKQIEEYFDVDSKGNITKDGFIQMYELQSSSEPEETIKDLSKLGYNVDDYLV